MRHLVYMRTPVRVGVADGAIDVTSTVVGKVSELGHGEVSLTLAEPCSGSFAQTVRASGCAVPENRSPERPGSTPSLRCGTWKRRLYLY
jgi:hypothetical protein